MSVCKAPWLLLKEQLRRVFGISLVSALALNMPLLQRPFLYPMRLIQYPFTLSAKSPPFSLSQLFAVAGVGFAWCRLFHLYGEHESPLRLGGYLQKCLQENQIAQLSDGADILDFSDVKDVARGIVSVVLKKHQGPANICSGRARSVRQFAEEFASRMGKSNLLSFSPRTPNSQPPKFIVGEPTPL